MNESNAQVDLTAPDIGRELELYLRHLDGLAGTLPLTMSVIHLAGKGAKRRLEKFENEHCKVTQDEKSRNVTIEPEQQHIWNALKDRKDRYDTANDLVPRSVLVAMVSQYDAYLGRLLRAIFLLKPDTLNASERSLTYAQISRFGDLKEVREYLIEKEVETILRSSHIDQFKWMENRFDVSLNKGLEIWPSFVELTERRNLYVHADGIVSRQYLAVCAGVGYVTSAKEGERLAISRKYFDDAFHMLYEIGTKLAHVLWRKLLAQDREAADRSLSSVCYRLLESRGYKMAGVLLEFARGIKKHSNEWYELVFTVNTAQCYKWTGENEKALAVLGSVDWSAKSDEFKLANHALREEWDLAAVQMKKIGPAGSVKKTEYRDWPLFQKFRERPEFLSTYKDVFGEDFVAARDRGEVLKLEVDDFMDGANAIEEEAKIPKALPAANDDVARGSG